MKLMKELYLIDRTYLDRWNRVLTGDIYFSMKNGPVLSNVLNNINSSVITEDKYWAKHISRSGNYNISLKTDKHPSNELSTREKKVIDEIFVKFKDMTEWDIVEWCHQNLKEWTALEDGRAQIFIEDILKALGKTKEELAEIQKEISSFEFAKKAFSDE